MTNSQQDFGTILQHISDMLHAVTSLMYVIIMRTGQYFSGLNVQLKTETGVQGLDILASFLPMIILLVVIIFITSLMTWFLRNYELSFG